MSEVTKATGALREEILAAESARQVALIAKDIDALDALFDESLVHVHAPGEVHTKPLLLEHVATRGVYLEITRGDLLVRTIGEVAIVTGSITNRMKAPGGGERTLSGEVTQVLRQTSTGDWKFISFHMTPYGDKVWGKLPSQGDVGAAGLAGSTSETKESNA
ncbi:YybH family protein [Leucobacter sp. W1153]|uniref:YybH family protein n=1 Tax=Leucobacter sp. W1153 TaxID=3439064 RepID=UPI003F2B190F